MLDRQSLVKKLQNQTKHWIKQFPSTLTYAIFTAKNPYTLFNELLVFKGRKLIFIITNKL